MLVVPSLITSNISQTKNNIDDNNNNDKDIIDDNNSRNEVSCNTPNVNPNS